MSRAQVIASRLRGLFGRDRLDTELDQEVRFHLETQIEDNLAAGMDPVEARRAALRSFGGIEPMKETIQGPPGVRLYRGDSAGSAVRASRSAQKPGLHGDVGDRAGPGDRRSTACHVLNAVLFPAASSSAGLAISRFQSRNACRAKRP